MIIGAQVQVCHMQNGRPRLVANILPRLRPHEGGKNRMSGAISAVNGAEIARTVAVTQGWQME